MSKMNALVKNHPEPGMEVQQRTVPEPEDDEIRVKVKSVGIDAGIEGLIYDWHPSKHYLESLLPQIFGHEFAGAVDKVGKNVDELEVGDRVTLEPTIPCQSCELCRSGNENICPSREILHYDRQGGMAEYVTIPARNAYKFDDSLSYDEGMYLEILGVGVHALERSTLQLGDKIAVTGPGPVGLGVIAAAKYAGASSITAIGTEADQEHRLPVAERMGAHQTEVMGDVDHSEEFDLVFESSGAEQALDFSVEATRKGGEIVQLGLFHNSGSVSLDVDQLTLSKKSLQTTRGRTHTAWRRTINISKEMDLSPIIGPAFDLSDYEKAFQAVKNREGIKIPLHP